MNLLAGRRNQFSRLSAHSIRPALVKLPLGPEELTLSYLVPLKYHLDNFPLKNILKNVLEGGWQELVQFSFQHFGTDLKGNLLINKSYKNIYTLDTMKKCLLNIWNFLPWLVCHKSRVCFSTWVRIACFEFFMNLIALGTYLYKDDYLRRWQSYCLKLVLTQGTFL